LTIISVYEGIEKWLSKVSDRRQLIFVGLLSTLLVVVYFWKVIAEPDKYQIGKGGDNYKNYYTLKSYVDQPCNTTLTGYHSMNYPYPEVIYFTDNTPLLAVAVKAVKSLFGIAHIHPLFVFNLFSILNFVVCSILLFLLLKHFVRSNLLVLLGSITLAFANPQSIRYIGATVNLGYGSIMVAAMLLAVLLVKHRETLPLLLKYAGITMIFIVAVAFIHLYYLILILVFLSAIIFLTGAKDIWEQRSFRFMAIGGAVCAVPFAVVLAIIQFTDPFYTLRKNGANGYNWINWKLNFSGLFKAPDFYYAKFFIEPTAFIGYESINYLGCFAIYGVLLFAGIALLKGSLRMDMREVAGSKSGSLVLYILIATLVSFFIALGPEYYLSNEEYVFHNVFNVFRYAAKFTDKLTHFRCLGRFAWIFFWSFNLLVFVLADLYLSKRNKAMVVFLFVAGFFMIKDMTNTGEAYRRSITLSDFDAANRPAYIKQIASAAAGSKYDAIMVLPFFLVGSENYDQTLDYFDEGLELALQISDEMGLPIMSSMMSRTPLDFNTRQFNLYQYGTLDTAMQARLKGKRILVLKSNALYDKMPVEQIATRVSQKEAVVTSRNLTTQLAGMQFTDSINGIEMWRWQP
jgi:hypothetical protein